MFDEKSTFATHITLLRSHIAAITNLTEYDKKQLLVRSADSKVGDFHVTVSELVNGDYYRKASFNQIVAVLDNIYVTGQFKRAIDYEKLTQYETVWDRVDWHATG